MSLSEQTQQKQHKNSFTCLSAFSKVDSRVYQLYTQTKMLLKYGRKAGKQNLINIIIIKISGKNSESK